MREMRDYQSMPFILATVSVAFGLAAYGTVTGNAPLSQNGVFLAALVTPLALGYLHFRVLGQAPWWTTWLGLLLGAAGSGFLISESASWPGSVLLGGSFALVGLSFIVSRDKPNAPGVLFVAGGLALLVHALFDNLIVLSAGFSAIAATFAIGAALSARNVLRGAPDGGDTRASAASQAPVQ